MNLNQQQKIRIGACAWSFEDWREVFYPRDLPESRWLEFYARHFPTVEIDSTFYAAPAPDAVRRWLDITPSHFRFSCKLPREITHQCKLRDCSAELNGFLRAIEALAPKLHIILVQLPPSFLPKRGESPAAVVRRAIAAGFSVCHRVSASRLAPPAIHSSAGKIPYLLGLGRHPPLNERNLAPFEFQPCTTDFLYVRLLGDYTTKYDGDRKHQHRYGKLLWKREAALESWALKIERQLSDVRAVYAYLNNHFEGFALESAQRLAERLGYELPLPSTEAAMSAEDRKQLDLQL